MADTPLKNVAGWSANHIDRLKESWITTAEQVAALAATKRGVVSLAEQLGVSEAEARTLIASAHAELTPETQADMEKAVDTSEYGLGALRPLIDDD